MTAKDLYMIFARLFPELDKQVVSYSRSSPDVLWLYTNEHKRNAPAYMFVYRSNTDWELHYK